MPSPVADFYSAPSGAAVYVGRYSPGGIDPLSGSATLGDVTASGGFTGVSSDPTWLAGKPLNEWFAISGTAGSGGAFVNAWGALVVREDTSEVFILASGGHGDSFDNRVVSVDLRLNTPTWVLRSAASTNVATNVPYYADGKPTSRHNYDFGQWCPITARYMLFGCRASYGAGYDMQQVDGFDPVTNAWDAAGTWPTIPLGFGYSPVRNKSTGEVWTNGMLMWMPGTNTWSAPTTSGPSIGRFPVAYDSLRNLAFSLQWSDGQTYGYGTGLSASKFAFATNTGTAITFNASAAYTQWLAATPAYAGMDYDLVNDKFRFYNGGETGVVYVITPNSGAVWDMSILSQGAGTITPDATPGVPPANGAGINGRHKYIPALKGFLLLPLTSSTLYFMRTS